MRHYLVGATIFLACGLAAAQDTGDDFAERFAIGEERSALLKELVPGAPDYYYYHCLHLQNEGRLDEVAPLVEQWMKRHVTRDQPEPALLQRIVTRQALLEYSRNNRGSLDFLIKRLNLGFNHQRQLPDAQRRLPSALDEQLISRETLTRQALEQEVNLKQISANGLPRLVGRQLTALQRRDLLERLTRADVPGLVQVIADELAAKDGKAFGSLPIHKHLTMAQLEELETLRPQLLNESRFVGAVVARLVPPEGVDWNRNAEAREQHLDRLWAFATRLKPTFNSLKVHVLYHRLAHDRDLGRYDAASFEQYISLPRRAPYVRPEFLELPKHKGCVASLDSQFNTGLAAVADDAPLVQDYLHHLLARAESYGPYEQFIQSDYLRVRFAEAKLLAGEGDAERWYSMLTPSAVQELQQRVELTLAPTNKFYFEPDEDVALELDIKNIRTLIVRVYEINTLGYYQAMWQQLPADLNVDGLLPNHEMIFNFEEPPLRRVRFKCDLPQLKERGCYIVDFIGNGRSTRAVIRKGSIRFIQKPVADGHEFTLLDENGDLIRDGAILLGRQQLLPDAEGRIMVPPAEEDRHEQIILARGDFATLSSFARGGTACTLDARFYVEREALLPGQLATVMIQARLKRGLAPVPVKLLKDVVLTITASDQQLISTSTEVHDIMLSDDAMATHTFRVPEGLRTIQFKLSGKLQNDLSGREQQLSASFSQKVNHFDSTNLPASLRLVHAEGQYANASRPS